MKTLRMGGRVWRWTAGIADEANEMLGDGYGVWLFVPGLGEVSSVFHFFLVVSCFLLPAAFIRFGDLILCLHAVGWR
jgi:hypothetical protein